MRNWIEGSANVEITIGSSSIDVNAVADAARYLLTPPKNDFGHPIYEELQSQSTGCTVKCIPGSQEGECIATATCRMIKNNTRLNSSRTAVSVKARTMGGVGGECVQLGVIGAASATDPHSEPERSQLFLVPSR